MYSAYFGLQHEPFSIAPDPRFLYMSERHREALAHLLYGVRAGGGFVLLSGEIGAGKTTVCRCLLEQMPPDCNVAYIFNPRLTVPELLRTICEEFRVELPAGGEPLTVKQCLDPLNAYLLAQHAAGRANLLIIDEAQNLSAELLEQLRLLTNLETSQRKLLQIVLIGQPELRELLARPELEQLAQRVVARYHLGPLTPSEAVDYIRHRMAVAGLQGPLPFDDGALQRIHQFSGGIPRRINLLCDRALLGAYATGARVVDRTVVDKAAREVFDSGQLHAGGTGRARAPAPWAWLAAGMVAGIALGGAAIHTWMAAPSGTPVAVAPAAPAPGSSAAAAFTPSMPPAAMSPAAPAPAGAASSTAPGSVTPAPGTATMATAATPATSTATSTATTPAATTSTATVTPATLTAATTPGAATSPAATATVADLHRGLEAAWVDLGTAWGVKLDATAPCTAGPTAAPEGLRCFSVKGLDLNILRRLDQPAILSLLSPQAPGGAQTPELVHAVLESTRGGRWTLRAGNRRMVMTSEELAAAWRGAYATLWQPPPGFTGRLVEGSRGPAVHWLATRLAQINRTRAPAASASQTLTMDRALRQQVQAFQKAQGLNADGRAGPMTLMLLARASGDDIPRLDAPAR